MISERVQLINLFVHHLMKTEHWVNYMGDGKEFSKKMSEPRSFHTPEIFLGQESL